jgi:hypothetical protein
MILAERVFSMHYQGNPKRTILAAILLGVGLAGASGYNNFPPNFTMASYGFKQDFAKQS